MYRHHKGPLYKVVGQAINSTNAADQIGRPVVLYYSLSRRTLHTRDLAEFEEPVVWPDGQTRPRFAWVSEACDEEHGRGG